MGSRGPHLGVEQGTYSRQYKYRTGHHNADVCSVTSTVKKAQQPGHHQGGPGPSIVTTLVTRNINDWEVARFQQPEVAAHLLSAAGNEVKLDIDRCGYRYCRYS